MTTHAEGSLDRTRPAGGPSPAQRDTKEYERVERVARGIVEAFEDQEPLLTVMALRLAAQMIYDSRCRVRNAEGEEE